MFKSELVNIHHNKPFTNSLIIAKQFGKRHPDVTEKILKGLVSKDQEIRYFNVRNFRYVNYIDSTGETRKMYEITEDGFLDLGMSFTGEKAKKVRIRFIAEFRKAINEISRLQKLLNDPDRNATLIEKRKAGSAMCNSLQFVRQLLGKETDAIKYGNEYKFCWRALTGKWEKQDESILNAYDLRLLEKIRNHNTVLIALHPAQKDRKKLLDDFVNAYRIKQPRLQLVV